MVGLGREDKKDNEGVENGSMMEESRRKTKNIREDGGKK